MELILKGLLKLNQKCPPGDAFTKGNNQQLLLSCTIFIIIHYSLLMHAKPNSRVVWVFSFGAYNQVMANFLMTRILTTIFLICGLHSFGQTVRIDTFFLPNGQRFKQLQTSELKFPIVKTDNKKVDLLINNDLKNRFTDNAFPDAPTDSTLIKWADEQITYLDFAITYLKNGIVSLNISAEGCGAYCTQWTDYFTYSIETGKYLTLNDIIDITGNFKNIVSKDKNKQYEVQRKELKKILLDKNSGLGKDDYKSALEYYNNCDKSFALKSFALYSDHLEIIENCHLPHVMQNLTPVIKLKYKYSDITKYLKIKN